MPKHKRAFRCLALLALVGLAVGFQKNERAEIDLQAAIHKEIVEGEPEQAIRQYREILTKHAGNRAVVAKAWLHLGQCYEKLGQTEARKAYEKVVGEFADHAEVAAQARARLAQLSAAKAAGTAGEITVRRAWHGPDVGFYGKVSPDGRFLSYEDQDTDDLAIRDLQTGVSRRLGTSPSKADAESVDYSAWSPDGKQVAYGWWRADGTEELRVASVETGRFRTVRHYPPGDGADLLEWSPDGRHLAYISFERQGVGSRGRPLVIRALSSGEERRIQTGLYPALNLRWSADGRSFFVVGELTTDGHRGIYRFDAQTGERGPRIPVWPGWISAFYEPSSDGNTLFHYQADPQGVSEIAAHDLKTGAKKTIYRTGSREVVTLSASPDGRWIAFLNVGPKKVLRVIPATGGEAREVWRFEQPDWNPAPLDWSPDARHLYVFRLTSRGSLCSLWRVSVEGGQAEDLGVAIREPRGLSVHPDGRQIAFSAGQRHREVWLMENFLPKTASRR